MSIKKHIVYTDAKFNINYYKDMWNRKYMFIRYRLYGTIIMSRILIIVMFVKVSVNRERSGWYDENNNEN